LILAIDTATHMVGIALHDGVQVLAENFWLTGRHHTVSLAPEVAILLHRARKAPTGLTGIAVAKGPGSYTGLRIGMAFAKGLALAHGLPLIGVPTLEILAQAQPARSESMLATLKAGRGRIAGVWYKWVDTRWEAQGESENLTWDEVLKQLAETTHICGEMEPDVRKQLEADERVTVAEPAWCVRRPSVLAELAWSRIRAGELDDPALLAPLYLTSQTQGMP
jgi:tRNA threonylcarbamoyladenosine biosynthesis protein TsaB